MNLTGTKSMNEYQFGAQWLIERSTMRKSDTLQSPTYDVPNLPRIKYSVLLKVIAPKKHKGRDHDVHISLHLETQQEINVSCTISIKSASYKHEMIDQVYSKYKKSTSMKLSTRYTILDPKWKYFNADRMLKIELDGVVKIAKAEKQIEPGPMSLAKALWESSDKDVTIVAEKKEIKVHKWSNEYSFQSQWSFSKTTIRDVESSGYLESPVYTIPHLPYIKYHLALYPFERTEIDEEPLVYFWLNFETEQEINVSCTISVKSASYECEIANQVYDSNYTSNAILLCNRSTLFSPAYKFLDADKMLTIELDGVVKIEEVEKQIQRGPMSLAKALWESSDKDVTIVAEKKEIKVHKWILCGNSSVFKSKMEESRGNKIVITDFKFNTVKIAMEYCYERNIDSKITEENAYELLHFADKYDVRGLKDILQAILIQKITVSNVVHFANMSITSLSAGLCESCISFLMKYAGTNTAINNIKDLDNEIFQEIGRRSFNFL